MADGNTNYGQTRFCSCRVFQDFKFSSDPFVTKCVTLKSLELLCCDGNFFIGIFMDCTPPTMNNPPQTLSTPVTEPSWYYVEHCRKLPVCNVTLFSCFLSNVSNTTCMGTEIWHRVTGGVYYLVGQVFCVSRGFAMCFGHHLRAYLDIL